MPKNKITLDDVNSKVLERLYTLTENTENPEDLLALTEAIAKLNSSFRNNAQLASQDETSSAQLEAFSTLGEK